MKFWCGTAFMQPREMPAVARMLDQAGYHGMLTSDHLIYPRELTSPYPSPTGLPFWPPETAWPDTWVLIGAMAAVTERLHFSSAVYVAPAGPLLEVAKQVGTAAAISGGRVSLAVGAGWMREEFDLLGQSFDDRGKRLDEMIPALRALWRGGWVSWSGEHYRIPELMLEPRPPAPVPILCGGESVAAMKRAARLCDGWVGTGYTWDEAVERVGRIRRYLKEFGRDPEPFEIVVALREPPDADLFRRAEEIGVTGAMVSPWVAVDDIHSGDHSSLKHPAERYRAPIEQFAESVVQHCS
jgi:probable F420-dependent oxidoreductase